MQERKLPDDVTRCQGEEVGYRFQRICEMRGECLRHRQYDNGGPYTPKVDHACDTERHRFFIPAG